MKKSKNLLLHLAALYTLEMRVQTPIMLRKQSECSHGAIQEAVHIVRYLDKTDRPQEKFISLTPLHSTTAEGIYEKVVAVMDRAHIPMDKMAFCCFDGGSAYAGCHSGVQSLLRQRHNPRLVYIWCRNH